MTPSETWIPIGYARFASLSTAITLGSTTPTAGTVYTSLKDIFNVTTEPNHAIIDVETANVRIRTDGTAPTTTEGQLTRSGSKIVITDSPDVIRKLKAIEVTSGAQITVQYFI